MFSPCPDGLTIRTVKGAICSSNNRAALLQSAADIRYIMGWDDEINAGKSVQKQLFVELSSDEKIILLYFFKCQFTNRLHCNSFWHATEQSGVDPTQSGVCGGGEVFAGEGVSGDIKKVIGRYTWRKCHKSLVVLLGGSVIGH